MQLRFQIRQRTRLLSHQSRFKRLHINLMLLEHSRSLVLRGVLQLILDPLLHSIHGLLFLGLYRSLLAADLCLRFHRRLFERAGSLFFVPDGHSGLIPSLLKLGLHLSPFLAPLDHPHFLLVLFDQKLLLLGPPSLQPCLKILLSFSFGDLPLRFQASHIQVMLVQQCSPLVLVRRLEKFHVQLSVCSICLCLLKHCGLRLDRVHVRLFLLMQCLRKPCHFVLVPNQRLCLQTNQRSLLCCARIIQELQLFLSETSMFLVQSFCLAFRKLLLQLHHLSLFFCILSGLERFYVCSVLLKDFGPFIVVRCSLELFQEHLPQRRLLLPRLHLEFPRERSFFCSSLVIECLFQTGEKARVLHVGICDQLFLVDSRLHCGFRELLR
mmetsp:Transcript_65101/g.135705  ORF Transcript_65101/g.135705 Transcript_65101/m.135705 type:complete len:381 (-) Transcript_65101:5838-6980(-)